MGRTLAERIEHARPFGTIRCLEDLRPRPRATHTLGGNVVENVRFWPKADMGFCAAHVRFRGGRADKHPSWRELKTQFAVIGQWISASGSCCRTRSPGQRRIMLRPDFTCYETYVEGTGPDGQLLTLTYEQIASVDVE